MVKALTLHVVNLSSIPGTSLRASRGMIPENKTRSKSWTVASKQKKRTRYMQSTQISKCHSFALFYYCMQYVVQKIANSILESLWQNSQGAQMKFEVSTPLGSVWYRSPSGSQLWQGRLGAPCDFKNSTWQKKYIIIQILIICVCVGRIINISGILSKRNT